MSRLLITRQTIARALETHRELAWITLLSLAVRLLAARLVRLTPMVGDESDYYGRAVRLLTGDVVQDGFRAPGFEALLALLLPIVGNHGPALRMLCAGLSGLLVVPIYFIAQRLAGPRVARITGILTALYPPFIAFSHYFWAESLYTLGAACALLATDVAMKERRKNIALLAGGLWAWLILTREVAAAATATVLLWQWWRLPKGARRSVWLPQLVAIAIPVVVWSACLNRHNTEQDAFSLVTRTTYLNLYIGNGPIEEVAKERPRRSAREHYESLADTPAQREKLAAPLVAQAIRERGAAWLPMKLKEMVPRFVLPGGFAVRRLLIGDSQPKSPWVYRGPTGKLLPSGVAHALAYLYVFAVAAVLVLGTAGWLLHAAPSNLHGLITAYALGHWWPTVLAFAIARFRLPVMPLFILGAAMACSGLVALWKEASPLRRAITLVATALMLGIVSTQWHRALTEAWQ